MTRPFDCLKPGRTAVKQQADPGVADCSLRPTRDRDENAEDHRGI